MVIDGYCTLGDERDCNCNAKKLIRELDEAGIEKSVIAPQDREIICQNQSGNDRILLEHRRHPERFIPSCTVNPWFGDEAIRIIEDAVDGGAQILCLAPALQGFILGDEICHPVLQWAGSNNLPVYIHTGNHAYSTPAQLLIYAKKFPQTQFICGHCGSTDYGREMRPVMELGLGNIWYELSFVRPWCLPEYLSLAGPDRVIFGSSAPRNKPSFELRQFTRILSLEDNPQVYGGNLLNLLGGDNL